MGATAEDPEEEQLRRQLEDRRRQRKLGRKAWEKEEGLQEEVGDVHKADQEAVPAAESRQELREEVAEDAEEAYSSWQD